MLATMTYNGAVILSVIAGLTIGYYIFAPNEKVSDFLNEVEVPDASSEPTTSDASLQTLLPECINSEHA